MVEDKRIKKTLGAYWPSKVLQAFALLYTDRKKSAKVTKAKKAAIEKAEGAINVPYDQLPKQAKQNRTSVFLGTAKLLPLLAFVDVTSCLGNYNSVFLHIPAVIGLWSRYQENLDIQREYADIEEALREIQRQYQGALESIALEEERNMALTRKSDSLTEAVRLTLVELITWNKRSRT